MVIYLEVVELGLRPGTKQDQHKRFLRFLRIPVVYPCHSQKGYIVTIPSTLHLYSHLKSFSSSLKNAKVGLGIWWLECLPTRPGLCAHHTLSCKM